MAKKTKAADAPAEATAQPVEIKRVWVRISAADFETMQKHFAEGRPGLPLVAIHPAVSSRELTDEQREKRKEYRQRPDVREKQKTYRAKRAERVRQALALAKQMAAEARA